MDEFERGLESAKNEFDSFSSNLKNAGEKISNAGGTLTKSVTVPIVGLGTAIIKAGSEYEAGMDEVAAISGATGAEIEALGDKAMEMAAKTKFSTAESAEAYKYMAMAGWKTNDMLNALDAVMYLAGASGESLGTTSDIVTDAMTAFGLAADGTSKILKDGVEKEVSNATRFTDVLAAASNNSNTNVSMMGQSFKYAASVAGTLGYSIEDVAIALGLMANSGIKADMAGTALRTILQNISSPPSKGLGKKAMDALGLSFTDAEGKAYSLLEIMQQIRAGFGGGELSPQEFSDAMAEIQSAFDEGEMSEKEYETALDSLMEKMYGLEAKTKASYAKGIAGQYGMAGFLAIINASEEDFNKLTEAIYNSNGATEEMYNVMTDNAKGAVTMLSSAINVLFTNLSQFLIPAFTDVVRKITDVVNWFNSLDDGIKKVILTIAGIAAVVGPVLIVTGKIITAIGTISGAVSGVVGVVTKGVTSIIGIGSKLTAGIKALFALIMAHPVVAVVTAIIAAVVLLYTKCEWFRDGVKAVIDTVVGFFKGAWEAIKAAWGAAGEFFSGIIDGIKSAFAGIGEFIGGLFKSAWEAVKSAWNGAKEFFSGVWESIKSVFSVVADVLGGFFKAAWDVVKTVWGGAKEFFSAIWEGIKSLFSTATDVIGGAFLAAWEAAKTAWNGAKEFFSGIWEGIKSVFSSVAEVIGGAFQAAWDVVSGIWEAAAGFFGNIAAGIQSVFESVTEAIGSAFRSAWEVVQSVWSAAADFFSSVWEGIKSGVGAVGEKIIGALKGAWGAVKSAWDGAVSFFSGIASKIVGAFTGIGGKFLDIGRNIVNGIKNGISGAWDSFIGWLNKKVGGIVDGVKKMLGIKSPSTVFASIGGNMVLGLGKGWSDEYDGIKQKIENGLSFGNSTVGINTNYSGTARYGAQGAAGRPGGWGNTYVTINSPEAVDGVQAARVWRKETQKMAIAYV